jgi:hypothetical protein
MKHFPEDEMRSRLASIGRLTGAAPILCVMSLWLVPSIAAAQPQFVIKPVAEKKLARLPVGPLYWWVENFPTLGQAQAAEGPTSLAAEARGKAWLLTLGPKGGTIPGGTKVTEIGPIPSVTAPEYLLRITHSGGPPGAKTPVHSHPGAEAFYVLSGRMGQRTPHGVGYAEAGETMNGHDGDMPMEVFSAGTTDLDQLVMFVVDATRPFAPPAKFE